MVPEIDSQNTEGEAAPRADRKKRQRSTIEFPYGDLDDAVAVARGVHSVGGSGCGWDQIAGHFKQAANGGGFRQRMLTAKVFGFIVYAQSRVKLTSLGHKVCDPSQEKAAKAEAFLNVPLYKEIYEKFSGKVLPGIRGLEAQMVELGVTERQSDKARQYFQRSASQADFYWTGQERLVMPKGISEAAPEQPSANTDQGVSGNRSMGNSGGTGTSGGGGGRHQLIEGLIERLPMADEEWTLDKRLKWLQAASYVFDLIYADDSTGQRIEVKIHRETGNE